MWQEQSHWYLLACMFFEQRQKGNPLKSHSIYTEKTKGKMG